MTAGRVLCRAPQQLSRFAQNLISPVGPGFAPVRVDWRSTYRQPYVGHVRATCLLGNVFLGNGACSCFAARCACVRLQLAAGACMRASVNDECSRARVRRECARCGAARFDWPRARCVGQWWGAAAFYGSPGTRHASPSRVSGTIAPRGPARPARP